MLDVTTKSAYCSQCSKMKRKKESDGKGLCGKGRLTITRIGTLQMCMV